MFAYGLGTALEGYITLAGNSIVANKAWYIAGAGRPARRWPAPPNEREQQVLRSEYEHQRSAAGRRAIGNALIAFGAILPGVGGGMAKAGHVEALYIGEFVGLLFIWAGFHMCVRSLLDRRVQAAHRQAPEPAAA